MYIEIEKKSSRPQNNIDVHCETENFLIKIGRRILRTSVVKALDSPHLLKFTEEYGEEKYVSYAMRTSSESSDEEFDAMK